MSTEPVSLGLESEERHAKKQRLGPGWRLGIAAVLALLCCVLFITWDINGAVEYILTRRTTTVIGMIIVGAAVGCSSVVFQTVTGNRILTPSIMGFDSLFVLVQTVLVFALGSMTLSLMSPTLLFFGQTVLMVVACMTLYVWLLVGARRSLQVVLLVGVVLATFFRSISLFLQRVIDPNEFLVLQDAFFASFNSIEDELVPWAALLVGGSLFVLWRLSAPLDVMGLGREMSINLGVDHRRVMVLTLFLVAVLISASTALVGPSTFLGLIVAHVSYQLAGSYKHRVLFPFVTCVTVVTLVGGQFVAEHVFGLTTPLSVVIEFVGGLLFIFLVLRRRPA